MKKRQLKAGLLGFPLSKSRSAAVFAAFGKLLREDILFEPLECSPADLEEIIPSLRPRGWAGFSVTIPHKRAVFALLNLADPAAQACGAVNAVRFGRAGLEGMNTDAHALRQALEEAGFDPAGKDCAVFGAGGSAASSGWALGRSAAASVTFHARNPGEAAALAARLSCVFPKTLYKAAPWGAPARETAVAVNATPLGMYQPGRPPFEPRPGALCADLAYADGGTEFVRDARAAGAAVIDGFSLLVWQAALALRYWTGLPTGDIVKFKREADGLLQLR